jgi:hypothetical protein
LKHCEVQEDVEMENDKIAAAVSTYKKLAQIPRVSSAEISKDEDGQGREWLHH